MRERQIKFSINKDQTLVEINGEDKKYAINKVNDLLMVLSLMKQQINENCLEVGFHETQLSLIEHYSVDILKSFNFDSVLQKQQEERHKEIKSLNIENRELRKQLGDKVSAEDIRESLKNISEKLNTFWDAEGFQHIRNMEFGQYGVKAEFNTDMLSSMWHDSKEELTKHRDKLRSYGLTLVADDDEEGNAIDFSKENLDALNSIFSKYFSDFQFTEVYSRIERSVKTQYIRGVQVYIRNFNDLINLPFPTYSEKENS